jgi:hypothetical protein
MADNTYEKEVLPEQEADNGLWIDKARKTAKELARRKGQVTIDDVRIKCPPPPKADSRVMGAVFRPKHGWVLVGYRKSDRKDCHGRPVAIWSRGEAA